MNITDIIGGSVTDGVAKIISLFKVDPNLALEKSTELQKIQAEMQGKVQDAISQEIQSAAEIIKAEATSQSWLARNVRPLLLLLWGCCISVNVVAAIVARFYVSDFQPIPLDPWVYKLTAIGFTGYVTARTWEKVTNSDK